MANNTFSSKVGLIMAAAGSAVGLGNIWKFPYVAGENGGGAFLLVYLACVVALGLPMVATEFLIGQRSRHSAFGAFRELNGNNRWQWLSWMCLTTSVMIMGFYFVVTGWCFNYLAEAVVNTFHAMSTDQLTAHFNGFIHSDLRMMLFSLVPIVLTAAVLWFDVNKGIEQLSKILMPLLLVMMILMVIRVLMLENSMQGLRFFFHPDFSKITPNVILEAMGQCFFSLSVGMGALITYGAYMPPKQRVVYTSVQVAVLDTLVAVLAGVIIFPAVFSFGFNPEEGPKLAFVVLPAILEQMSLSWFSSVLFFSLLCIAALTSTISLMEVSVAYMVEVSEHWAKKNPRIKPINRHKSVLLVAVVTIVITGLCVLSMTDAREWLSFGGHNLFDLLDDITSCYLMPLGALGMSIFVAWKMPLEGENGLTQNAKGLHRWVCIIYQQMIRWIIPIVIVVIFLYGLDIL